MKEVAMVYGVGIRTHVVVGLTEVMNDMQIRHLEISAQTVAGAVSPADWSQRSSTPSRRRASRRTITRSTRGDLSGRQQASIPLGAGHGRLT
jgi:hypothetical protein